MSASSRRQNASLSDVTVSPGSSFSVGPHTSAQWPYPNRQEQRRPTGSAEQIRCADMPCHVAGPCVVCHAVGGYCRGGLAHAAQLTWTDRLRLEVRAKHQQLFFHLVHHLRIEPPSPIANAPVLCESCSTQHYRRRRLTRCLVHGMARVTRRMCGWTRRMCGWHTSIAW